jgi:outer membrane protein W
VKKLIIVSLAILLCLPAVAYAATIGGTETQGKGKLSIGLDQEFVFNRDMEFVKETGYSITPGSSLQDVEINDINRTMIKASYGVIDNLDIYVRLGIANLNEQDRWYVNGNYDSQQNLTGKCASAYGLGLKYTYPLGDKWLLGVDAQYLRHRNSYSGKWTIDDSPWQGHMTIQEWQIAPYVARRIGNFIPYLGVKYSDLRLLDKGNDNSQTGWNTTHKAEHNCGVFLGTDFKIGGHWKLNIEGRFIDETAMSIGAAYKF